MEQASSGFYNDRIPADCPARDRTFICFRWRLENYFLPLLVLSKTNLYLSPSAWLTGADWPPNRATRMFCIYWSLWVRGSHPAVDDCLPVPAALLAGRSEPGQHQGLRENTLWKPLPQSSILMLGNDPALAYLIGRYAQQSGYGVTTLPGVPQAEAVLHVEACCNPVHIDREPGGGANADYRIGELRYPYPGLFICC